MNIWFSCPGENKATVQISCDREDLKKLIHAIIMRAYEDVCMYHESVMDGKPSTVRKQDRRKTNSRAGRPPSKDKKSAAELHYASSIVYFTNPYIDDDGHEHPSYFKYQFSLIDNEGDFVARKVLSNVLQMEKEINQAKRKVA